MTNFVLVHGGAHAAWCWDPLIPHLVGRSGVGSVTAVDLAGHGARIDEKPEGAIQLADYVGNVVDLVEGAGMNDVVLVGHSLAAITITPAAHVLSERLRRIVYLSTTNPESGRSVMDAMTDPLAPDTANIDLEAMFCNDLDPVTTEWLLSRLGPEPAGPMTEPVQQPRPPAGLPSTYILLEQDQALPPDFQLRQAANAGVDEIVRLNTGHSAFAADPEALAALLLQYV